MPSLKKFFTSLRYALRGLALAWQTQNNLRWHLVILVAVGIVGFMVSLSSVEWMFIVIVSVFVMVAELTNTMMERLVDLAKPRIHVYAQLIKDVMAGVTLLTALAAVIVGLLIFLPHIIPG